MKKAIKKSNWKHRNLIALASYLAVFATDST